VIPSTIEIKQDLSASGMVMSHPTQVNQIMMNLCTNAVHAMGETGGILEISLNDVAIDGASDLHGIDLAPGTYLRLSIRDTGKGMTPEVMEKIFEPYFTTKDPGHGTGLGLSVVHGIVKSHNGAITCRSLPGEGTVFDIYLPAIKSDPSEDDSLKEGPLSSGNERILFIDDEQVLVDMATEMLTGQGYRIIGKKSSIEALELFREDPDGFDLVITDMTMPGMTGAMLAKEIIAIRHDIPVILCTGYNEHISEERAKEIGISEFILKPMDLRKFTESIRKALDRNRNPHAISSGSEAS
jgi:CheY-like chemotaxis protein